MYIILMRQILLISDLELNSLILISDFIKTTVIVIASSQYLALIYS